MGVAEELSEVSEGGEADILEALLRELGKVALGKRAETVLVPTAAAGRSGEVGRVKPRWLKQTATHQHTILNKQTATHLHNNKQTATHQHNNKQTAISCQP